MKVFVSSRFRGMEEFRAAACTAIRDLGHEPVTVEDFPARPTSPRVACLDGVRQSGLVVLILGESYGDPQQPSGLSATHEEYREARGTRDVIAFVQDGVRPESAQQAFIDEVSAWTGGTLRRSFRAAEDLRSQITGAMSQWLLARATGPLNAGELAAKARALIPEEPRNVTMPHGPRLVLAIASGPVQAILRPSEIESPALKQDIHQAALFGPSRILTTDHGSKFQLEGPALRLRQEDRSDILLDPEGGIRVRLAFNGARERVMDSMSLGLVEEDVGAALDSALAFSAWLLDRVDATGRLTHVAPAATFSNASAYTWRRRADGQNGRSGWTVRMGDQPPPMMLTPPVIARPALQNERGRLVEDLLTLLRRQWSARS